MKKIHVANPLDKSYTKNRVLFWFGAYGDTYILAYGHFDNAFNEAMDYLAEHFPGMLANDEVTDAFNEALANGMSEDEAFDESLIDITTGGNYSDHIHSWEWGYIFENPTNQELIQFVKA